MGSLKQPPKKSKPKSAARTPRPAPSAPKTPEPAKVIDYTSLSEGFTARNLKARKLGDDWRFSTGSTLHLDIEPNPAQIPVVVEYMAAHPGTGTNVNVSSILRGAK